MKNIIKSLILISLSMIVLSGCSKYTKIKLKDDELTPKSSSSCNNEYKEYFEKDGRKIYLVCLDEIYVEKDLPLKFKLSLSSANFEDDIDDLIKDLKETEAFNDGGSKLYKNDKISVLKCKTLNKIEDAYIGNKDMKYESNFCKNHSIKEKILEIVDKSKDSVCAQALEQFYEDDDYTYFYSCLKGNNVVVKYTDGTEETVSDAINYGNIQISDLDKYNIDYIKMKKDN